MPVDPSELDPTPRPGETEREAERRAARAGALIASALRGPFRWNAGAGRYISASGRFVPQRVVIAELERGLARAAANMRRSSQALREGRTSLRAWQRVMMAEIKNAHIVSAALGQGGFKGLAREDLFRIGRAVRYEYGKLKGFAAQIAEGSQRLDGTMLRRAEQYVKAARTTYYRERGVIADRLGFAEERNVLSTADHCVGCVAETDRGWVARGNLSEPGTRDCLRNCLCHIEYRRGGLGSEVWDG